MRHHRLGLLALGIISAGQAMAAGQVDSKGFVEDSSLVINTRNAYINRDYKNGNEDRGEWGQAFMGVFNSGFTQGTVGVGVDAFGFYAINLDSDRSRSGAGGVDFFKRDSSGDPAEDLARVGAAVKARISNTVIKYGDQMPQLPVLSYDNSRLLPETYTGTMITSNEIEGLELVAGRFTSQVRKSATGHDSGDLKSINVYGGSYKFTDEFTAAFYA
ncbi:MAG: rane protein, partial [Pseudomonas sp.]|nr:rane protein [Pseudomonas sp.]